MIGAMGVEAWLSQYASSLSRGGGPVTRSASSWRKRGEIRFGQSILSGPRNAQEHARMAAPACDRVVAAVGARTERHVGCSIAQPLDMRARQRRRVTAQDHDLRTTHSQAPLDCVKQF